MAIRPLQRRRQTVPNDANARRGRASVEAEYGVMYRPGGLYTSLRRLGVRPQVPCPVAAKANPAAQAETFA